MATQVSKESVEDSRPVEAVSQTYALLSRCFSYPDESLEPLRSEGIEEELRGMMEGLPFKVDKGIPSISSTQEALQILYTSTFDMPMPPCPLTEAFHRRGEAARDDIIEGVTRFYEHFGVGLKESERGSSDHLAAELEFMAYLSGKEVDAIKRGKDPNPYRLAQRDFLVRHLSRWVKKLDKRVQKLVEEPFYKGAFAFLKGFISLHLRDINQKVKVIEKYQHQ